MAQTADTIRAAARETSDYVIDRRRWYHAHPEVAYEEHDTTAQICADLTPWAFPTNVPPPPGVVSHAARGRAGRLP